MRLALSLVVVVVLAGWVVATALNQHERSRRWIGKLTAYDIAGLLPVWTFFAPNPGDTDTHLLYRDRDADGRTTDWREVRLAGRERTIDLWNPRRRMNKAIVDVVYDLTRRDADSDAPPASPGPQPISKKRVLTFPYLLLLNYVSQLAGDFGAVERQFAIARTAGMTGRDAPDVMLVSPFHRLAG